MAETGKVPIAREMLLAELMIAMSDRLSDTPGHSCGSHMPRGEWRARSGDGERMRSMHLCMCVCVCIFVYAFVCACVYVCVLCVYAWGAKAGMKGM